VPGTDAASERSSESAGLMALVWGVVSDPRNKSLRRVGERAPQPRGVRLAQSSRTDQTAREGEVMRNRFDAVDARGQLR